MKKRAWIALYTAAGLLTPVGLTAISPTTVFAATNPMLHYGSRGSAVQQLQRKLNALGFNVGTADGDFGPATLSGVKRFQKSRHLVTDGVVGPNTWGALDGAGSPSSKTPPSKPKSSTPTTSPKTSTTSSAVKYPGRLIRYGIRGYDVKEVQLQLNRLGFNTGYADGIYGPKTYAGVRAFQRAHHLTQDGIVGPQTWPILFGTSTSSSSTKPSSSSTTSSSSTSSSAPSSRGSSLPTVTYRVYDFSGAQQGGVYSTESAAQTAAKAYPRGVVKDSTGKVVYTQPGYAAYSDPGHLLGVYSSWTAANNKAGASGYVVNANNVVDRQPSEYYILNSSGQWQSSKYGVQGSAKPASNQAQANVRYLPVTPSGGAVNSVYYPFEQGTSGDGAYIGNVNNHFSWENPYRTANLTLPSGQPASGANIDSYIEATNSKSSLYGLGYSYMDAEKFGSNAVYLFSHSILESNWGNSPISQGKNNLFGYGAYDSNPGNDAGAFPTDDYAIHFESWFVRHAYLNPGGSFYQTSIGPTLDGMNKKYATDPNWSSAIAGLINNYADQHGYTTNGSTPITPITDSNGPNGNGEPVYTTTGNNTTFDAVVPAFHENLSYAPNVTSDDVKTLQDALNASGCGPLTVDGQFGTATETAVKKYQAMVGMTQSGTVDQTMWNHLFPAITGLKSVSEIYMSYTNFKNGATNLAISQVLTNTGARVFEPFVHFTNVYRVEPATGAEGPQARITVYTGDGTGTAALTDKYGQVYLHAGDFVSNSNGGTADASGMIPVNFTQWRNGAPVVFSGYVAAHDVQMPKDLAGQNTLPTYNGLDPANEQY